MTPDVPADASALALNQEVARIVDDFCAASRAELGDRVKGLVHFGSTVWRPVGWRSDIDIFLVVEGLSSNRRDRIALAEKFELLQDPALTRLNSEGLQLSLSTIVRAPADLERFDLIYLDWVDRARIVYDPDGLIARLVDRVRVWIARRGAQRVQAGLRSYWILGDGRDVGRDDSF